MRHHEIDRLEQRARAAVGIRQCGELADHLSQIATDERPHLRAIDRDAVVEGRIGPDDRLDLAHRSARVGLKHFEVGRASGGRRPHHERAGAVAEDHARGAHRPDLVGELLGAHEEDRPAVLLQEAGRFGESVGQPGARGDQIIGGVRLENAELARDPGGDRGTRARTGARAEHHGADFFRRTSRLDERGSGRAQRELLQVELGVQALHDPGLRSDVLGGHGRPAIGRVPDEVVVGAGALAFAHGQGLQARHDRQAGANVDRRAHRGRRPWHPRPWRAARPPPSRARAPDKTRDGGVARVEHDDDVVVGEVLEGDERGALAVPAELIVQDHRVAHERLQLRHAMRITQDVVVGVSGIIGRVVEQPTDQRVRSAHRLGDRRIQRLDTDAGRLASPKDLEQDAEHHVLRPLIAPRGKPVIAGVQGVDGGGDIDIDEARQEDVGALTGHVTPARGPTLVHSHRVAIAPEEMADEVAQQRVALAIGAGVEICDDLRFRARFVLEVASDDGLEVLQRVEDREIQLRLEIERKHDTTVAIEHKRLHSAHLRGVSRRPRLAARA